MKLSNYIIRVHLTLSQDMADKGRGGKDNVRELTGLEFGKSQRAVENRETWRKQVAKLSVMTQ